MPYNVDRHPTRAATYIAYDAAGFAFRVTHSAHDGWRGVPSHAAAASDARRFAAGTLTYIAGDIAQSKRA